jgi:hypothetical protein
LPRDIGADVFGLLQAGRRLPIGRRPDLLGRLRKLLAAGRLGIAKTGFGSYGNSLFKETEGGDDHG